MTAHMNETQRVVVAKLAEVGATVLVRWPGGFWTYRGCPKAKSGVPEWWVGTATIYAMDRKGILNRLYTHPQEWRDDRELAVCPK